MHEQVVSDRKWKKAELYLAYWSGYLLFFTLVEGITNHDFLPVFRNELISLPPKALFVGLVIEWLFRELPDRGTLIRKAAVYVLLITGFAFLMRLIDNYVILNYFLTDWIKEPLLSASPFLYNIIKLQFLITIPFCLKLYRYVMVEKNRSSRLAGETGKNSLLVKCERRIVTLLFDDIYYFEAQGNYLEISTVNGTFKTYLSISQLEEKLPHSKFARIHRSFVVALNKVESHNYSHVTIGHKKLPIGRSYLPNAKKSFPTLN